MKYILEIYQNNECIVQYKSETPFGAFSVGDTIDAIFVNGNTDYKFLKIRKINHIIFEIQGEITHSTGIYT